jgi:hypothetical protein
VADMARGEARLGPIGARLQARREASANVDPVPLPPSDRRRAQRARATLGDGHVCEPVEDLACEGAASVTGEIIGHIAELAADGVWSLGDAVIDALSD